MKDLTEDCIIILVRRLNNGFIRNGHNVLSISDRDILHNNKSIKDLKGLNTSLKENN